MVPLATTRSGFEAQILAARLGAEGIVWQLRGGSSDSVYPVGSVDILVTEDDLDRARELLTADDQAAEGPRESVVAKDRTEWWLAAVIVVAICVFIALRMFSL